MDIAVIGSALSRTSKLPALLVHGAEAQHDSHQVELCGVSLTALLNTSLQEGRELLFALQSLVVSRGVCQGPSSMACPTAAWNGHGVRSQGLESLLFESLL